jgi:hypothetical protein
MSARSAWDMNGGRPRQFSWRGLCVPWISPWTRPPGHGHRAGDRLGCTPVRVSELATAPALA